jgi:hypothetical protein
MVGCLLLITSLLTSASFTTLLVFLLVIRLRFVIVLPASPHGPGLSISD